MGGVLREWEREQESERARETESEVSLLFWFGNLRGKKIIKEIYLYF